MRFNIKEMKKQGIFLGVLAGFLAVVILLSYITSLSPAIPTVDEDSGNNQTQTNNDNNTGNGTTNSTTQKQEGTQVKEHTHNWVKGSTVEPTCTEGGYTINTCFCGKSKTTNEKAALGHDLGEWVTQPADENGVVKTIRTCSVCDYFETKEAGGIEVEEQPDENLPEQNPEQDPEQTPPGEENPDNEGENGEDIPGNDTPGNDTPGNDTPGNGNPENGNIPEGEEDTPENQDKNDEDQNSNV